MTRNASGNVLCLQEEMSSPKTINPASLKELADYLNLSPGTVSRALNGNQKVKTATRERVKRAADELGYTPNPLARGLIYGKSGFVGVSFAHFKNLISGVFLSKLLNLLDAHGKRALVEVVKGGRTSEQQIMKHFAMMRVDGVIMVGSSAKPNDPILQPLLERKIPYAIVSQGGGELPCSVQLNRRLGYKRLVSYLLEMEHSQFVLLGMNPETSNAQPRIEGVREALQERNGSFERQVSLVYDPMQSSESTFDYGRRLAEIALAQNPRMTAVLASNDEIALGAMHLFLERGKQVPGDISVAGFDNQGFAAHTNPSLTTIDQQIDRTLQVGVDLLFRQMQIPQDGSPSQVMIEPELILRDSTGRMRKPKSS